jgi:hypothetical protein
MCSASRDSRSRTPADSVERGGRVMIGSPFSMRTSLFFWEAFVASRCDTIEPVLDLFDERQRIDGHASGHSVVGNSFAIGAPPDQAHDNRRTCRCPRCARRAIHHIEGQQFEALTAELFDRDVDQILEFVLRAGRLGQCPDHGVPRVRAVWGDAQMLTNRRHMAPTCSRAVIALEPQRDAATMPATRATCSTSERGASATSAGRPSR